MNHEGREGHEGFHKPFSMRLPSPLSADAELIVVELRAIALFDDVHKAQVISYMRTTGLRGGLLINFRVPVLKRGLQRIVL
jgi:PD-(D/E)XK nuclease superfamily protein